MTIKSYNLSWEPDDPATPALVEPMLDEMFGGDDADSDELAATEATKEFLLERIHNKDECWTMDGLSDLASGYWEGYLHCLKKGSVCRRVPVLGVLKA
jgi:hypothetical protein